MISHQHHDLDDDDTDPFLDQFLAGRDRAERRKEQALFGCLWFGVAIVVIPILMAAAISSR